jgi:hypothetical protein
MAVLSKVGTKVVENVADFLKSFSDKIFYHSTTQDIKQFDPEIGIQKGLYPDEEAVQERGTRGATYLSSNIDFINENIRTPYKNIYKTGTNIMPLKIRDKNLFDITNKKHINKLEKTTSDNQEFMLMTFIRAAQEGNIPVYEALENPHIQKNLKEAGFRGYKTDEPETVAMFYPEDIRSVFAKFDPARSRSDDILASGLVGATSYGALGALDGETSD